MKISKNLNDLEEMFKKSDKIKPRRDLSPKETKQLINDMYLRK